MLHLAIPLDSSDELLMGDDERRAFLAYDPRPVGRFVIHDQKRGATGYRGVTRARGKFQVQVRSHGTLHYLGVFPTAEEAAHAYDAKARELHGELAILNFPDETTEEAA